MLITPMSLTMANHDLLNVVLKYFKIYAHIEN